ncbi:hypothetical protein PHYPSEUDO_002382 [Phytophthora pseudosyringae]|uniref:SPRY domain-containing protein n=1 Tax=Phytophthora pseudosyringae TaxID=221518 RepID=A0A8T1VXH0_9STRA|nr:hypothetical protein PHYPSEUDO_002382 [Phytophthora pseudosyringae]
MAFDPRCVSFEGRLHADRRTAEYVGRASHVADAASFRSGRAAGGRSRSRVFYFETRVVATSRDPRPELAANSLPPRLNTEDSSSLAFRRHAAQDRNAAAATTRDWRRRAEREAMDMEDVQTPALSSGVPVNFNFSLDVRTTQQMRSRIDRRRLRRSNERKRFGHKVAVGFILDEPEPKIAASGIRSRGVASFSTASGFLEARRTVKQLMQRVLPDRDSDSSSEEEEEAGAGKKTRKTYPATLHRDLGESVNSLAYVGKTGRVISHGREFLQCERYGAGDVVGCGVLLDTNTFFFTLNGMLMGMLAARDVYDLDDFGEMVGSEEQESDEDDTDSGGEDDQNRVEADQGVRLLLARIDDVEMEDIDGRHEEEKALYPAVSLHGVGECVQGVFEQEEFQFDLSGFELQIQKERQRALLAERERRSENGPPSDAEQADCKDEAAMNELVQDFFLHYGYESAYKAFESALAPSKRQRLSSDGIDMNYGDEVEASTVTVGVSCVEDMEDESKSESENMGYADTQPSLYPPKKQQMHESLSLRHEVRDHIRCFRTAQALVVLEQHVTALLKNWSDYRSRRLRKLMLYCRILCVIDVLTSEGEAKPAAVSPLQTNGASTPSLHMDPEEVKSSGWNPELAIEFARQVFRSSSEITTNGKRKRQAFSNGAQRKREGTDNVALVMSLLLYNQRESIPATNRAQKFLTPEFRDSVADQLNSLLLMSDDAAKTEPRVSALETFMNDLENLQKECLHQGCHVYPESVESTSNGKSKTTLHRHRASVSSSSDDSLSSQSEQDGHLDDDDDDYAE